ncbi:MAG: hypothetical protein K0Q66_1120 [Chitinophagaceae bacterium]|jgi:hypothetical protein|nr:hypothetical protein [Chitinophagaceae bacterium]
MHTLRYILTEKYRSLVRMFSEALQNNRPSSELEKINKQIRSTILQLNQVG